MSNRRNRFDEVDYGTKVFLQAKKVNIAQGINSFMRNEGKEPYKIRHLYKTNNYIKTNWNRFASFIDKSLKAGELQGEPIKLNMYYDERAENRKLMEEEISKLTEEQKLIIKWVKKSKITDISRLQSFVNKKGYSIPQKETHYTYRVLNFLPLIDLCIQLDYINELNKQTDEHRTNNKEYKN